MASNLNELSGLVLKRFKDVPNVDADDAKYWTELSMLEHGYSVEDQVQDEDKLLIIFYAEADGATQIALRTSYYFAYKDGEEDVDKTKVASQFRALSKEMWERYYRKRTEANADKDTTTGFRVMPRLDR